VQDAPARCFDSPIDWKKERAMPTQAKSNGTSKWLLGILVILVSLMGVFVVLMVMTFNLASAANSTAHDAKEATDLYEGKFDLIIWRLDRLQKSVDNMAEK